MKTEKVFVYGSLKKGFGNHPLLDGAEFLGNGVIKGFDMYSLGAFPAIVPSEKGIIHGELYDVSPDIFQNLDWLEGYPDFYDRKPVSVHVTGTTHHDVDDVWVYFHHEPYPEAMFVGDGNWR